MRAVVRCLLVIVFTISLSLSEETEETRQLKISIDNVTPRVRQILVLPFRITVPEMACVLGVQSTCSLNASSLPLSGRQTTTSARRYPYQMMSSTSVRE